MSIKGRAPAILAAALVSLCLYVASAAAADDHWVGTWGVPLQGTPSQKVTVKNQTVRLRLEISVGGPRLRIHLSNEYGSKPLIIGAASVAIANKDGSVKSGTFAQIKFGGSPKVTIQPGARMLSDPVDFKTEALQNLAVSLYLPEETVLSTYFQEERRPYEQIGYSPSSEPTLMGSVLSGEGDFTSVASMPPLAKPTQIFSPFLLEIDTAAPKNTPVVVILGDTKSHGPDMWPNYLRRRISPPNGGGVAVVNKSVWAGTLLLPQPFGTGITRFDEDVLGVAGVTHVFFFNGSNDVNMPGMNGNRAADVMSTGTITLAMQQVVERAHAAGLKVVGATLIPFEGVVRPGYATPEHMKQRNEVNAWIHSAHPFDALVDFDAAVRDPSHPERLLPAYDGGNHFTPSEAGMRAIANAIKAEVFKK